MAIARRVGLTCPSRRSEPLSCNGALAYLSIMGAFALLVMHGNGSGAWIPTFFIRRFGWNASQIGTAYGAVVLLFELRVL